MVRPNGVFQDKRFLQICKILQILFLILKKIDNKIIKNASIFLVWEMQIATFL